MDIQNFSQSILAALGSYATFISLLLVSFAVLRKRLILEKHEYQFMFFWLILGVFAAISIALILPFISLIVVTFPISNVIWNRFLGIAYFLLVGFLILIGVFIPSLFGTYYIFLGLLRKDTDVVTKYKETKETVSNATPIM